MLTCYCCTIQTPLLYLKWETLIYKLLHVNTVVKYRGVDTVNSLSNWQLRAEFKKRSRICGNVHKHAGGERQACSEHWAALWHSSCNSCSAHPSTTTQTRPYYYHHYQEPGWRNRCQNLLPARRVTWLEEVASQTALPSQSRPQVVRIITSSSLLCHDVTPPPAIRTSSIEMQRSLIYRCFRLVWHFINRQQPPAEALIPSCLTCTQV